MAVISTVATVAETDPMDLEPLYSAVDPDALNALFESPATDASRDDIRVTFAFHGHEVTVYSSGVITVRQPQETSSA